jgi:hypothetical protein
MTAPLSAQRVEALREWLGRLHGQGYSPSAIADLYVLCDDYSSMRAKNERLREDFEYKNEQLGSALIRSEKAEAENETLIIDLSHHQHDLFYAKAQLAKQAPLIQAVMGADLPGEGKRQRGWCFRWINDENEILEAALKLRSEK